MGCAQAPFASGSKASCCNVGVLGPQHSGLGTDEILRFIDWLKIAEPPSLETPISGWLASKLLQCCKKLVVLPLLLLPQDCMVELLPCAGHACAGGAQRR